MTGELPQDGEEIFWKLWKRFEESQVKDWIDRASYEDLLRRSRFGKLGDPIFQGERGEKFFRVMQEKKEALTHAQQVQASKNVGWDG